MAEVLIYSEKAALAAELVTAAKAVSADVAALAVNDAALAGAVAALGVDVYAVDDAAVALGDTAAMAAAVAQVAEAAGASTVLLASNRRGKELAGRLAAVLGAGTATDCGGLSVQDGKVVATRNNFGGATVAEVAVATDRKVFALSPKSFAAAEPAAAPGAVTAAAVDVQPSVKSVAPKAKEAENVDISAADVLVCAGCGFDSADQLADAERVAGALGGMVACSKPLATDRKWMSEARIVGISGTICKPELAVTLGVSGQVQFVTGVRDAKTIVAVDRDENAPIFQFADYGLVADLADALPELASALA